MSLDLLTALELHLTTDERVDSALLRGHHDKHDEWKTEHPHDQPSVEACILEDQTHE